MEPPVAMAVDPSGAPLAVDWGADRKRDDDKDYFGAGAFKWIAPFGLQHDSRARAKTSNPWANARTESRETANNCKRIEAGGSEATSRPER